MKVPLEISYRWVEKSAALDEQIRREVARLERVCEYISSCRVSVELPREHVRTGNPFRVRVDMTVPPGHELCARQEPGEGKTHDAVQTVVKETFDAARRQLEKLVRRQRGDVKSHPEEEENEAFVVRLFPQEGYGFIKTAAGDEVYFHHNAVTNHGYDRLTIGTGVRFVARDGVNGPQASTVEIIDKPGVRAQQPHELPGVEPPLGWKA
ncbi:MAG TPA: HPF/RaiA family ribosome-associated protein [Polyangia bacterium]|jgi:cold shock CspA family protein